MKISIRDPLKSQDAFGAYICYSIESNSNIPGFIYGEVTVIRRYSDFEWLSSELSKACPGAIIPALPDKQAVGRFQSDFVETRRRALERFLLRVAAHPELNVVPSFIAFLQANDATLKNMKNAAMEKKVSTLGSTAISWFEGKVNKMATGKVNLERTSEDFKIDEMTTFVTTLERCIVRVARQAEAIVRVERDSAKILAEFGQGLAGLGQCESATGTGGPLGGALSQLAVTVDALAATAALHAEAQCSDLQEPFDEYVRLLASVKLAIQQRADKKSAYTDALTDVEVKQINHNKVSVVPGKEDAANKSSAQLLRTEATAKETKTEYEAVTRRLIEEFDTFTQQKMVDMRDVLLNYAQVKAEYHRRAGDVWGKMVPSLEELSALPAGHLVRLDGGSSSGGLEVGSTSRLSQSLQAVTVVNPSTASSSSSSSSNPKGLPSDFGSPSIGSAKNPPEMLIGSPKLGDIVPPPAPALGGDFDPLGGGKTEEVVL